MPSVRNAGCSNSNAKLDSGSASALLRQRARHPDRLERLLAQVVRLLGVQREDLEGDRRIGHEQRDDRPDAELLQRLQPVVPVGREVAAVVTDRDNRIEKPPDRLDHAHQPLDVGVGRIALIRSRLHLVHRQRDQQQRRSAKRVAVAAQHGSAVGFDEAGQTVESRFPARRTSRQRRVRRRQARLSCVERISSWAAARPTDDTPIGLLARLRERSRESRRAGLGARGSGLGARDSGLGARGSRTREKR